MKNATLILAFLIIFTSSLASSFRQRLSADIEEKFFTKFIANRKIRLAKSANLTERRQNFIKKFYEIVEHNERYDRGEETFQEELNEFSTMSIDELKNMAMELDEPAVDEVEIISSRRKRAVLPSSWDWRDKIVIQAVQYQGYCPVCSHFAAIAAIESQMYIKYNTSVKLSEQESMECTSGCAAVWDESVYKYSKSKYGCTSASIYPYSGQVNSTCSSSRARVAKSRVLSYSFVAQNEADIRYYLYHKGPLYISYQLYENFYSYASGIFSNTTGSVVGAHAVLLVGYGTENNIDYWILKNSWGTNWGENGYFRMKRGVNLCRIENYRISYPVIE